MQYIEQRNRCPPDRGVASMGLGSDFVKLSNVPYGSSQEITVAALIKWF